MQTVDLTVPVPKQRKRPVNYNSKSLELARSWGIDEDNGKPFVTLQLNFGIGTCNDGESYDEAAKN